jgi:hypothetical protein
MSRQEHVPMRRTLKRAIVAADAALAAAALAFGALTVWPDPLFAFSLGAGKIVVASDRPIDAAGGERLLRECEALLAHSPLKAESQQYHIYVTNDDWRHRLLFLMMSKPLGLTYYYGLGASVFLSGAKFETGRLVHWRYVAPPPRTLAYFCAHELTHAVTGEHVGVVAFHRMPKWVREGFADYAAFRPRQSFDQLRGALGDRPVDNLMMQTYGSYPQYRLLVTYFLEKKNWSVDQLLATRLSEDEALARMRADGS